MTDIYTQKKLCRKAASVVRRECAQAAPDDIGQKLIDVFLRSNLLRHSSVISGYLPIGSELDIRPLYSHLTAMGYSCCLPVVTGKDQPLIFRKWQEGDELCTEAYGTSAPTTQAAQQQPDILFIPMLAWNTQLYRLGYGGGFYDRTLAAYRAQKRQITAVGIAYDAQKVEQLPIEEHDQPLDAIMTQERIYIREK